MRGAEDVPQHEVGAVEVAVGGRPGGQPGAAGVRVGVVAGGEALGVVERGGPQVLGRERRTTVHGGVRLRHEHRPALRH